MIKKIAFQLLPRWRISDSGQAGKNKELSSRNRARPRVLDRQTALAGGGGWKIRPVGAEAQKADTGDSGTVLAPAPPQTLTRPAAGPWGAEEWWPVGGWVFVCMNEALWARPLPCCFWEGPTSVSCQKWLPHHRQAAEGSS